MQLPRWPYVSPQGRRTAHLTPGHRPGTDPPICNPPSYQWDLALPHLHWVPKGHCLRPHTRCHLGSLRAGSVFPGVPRWWTELA